MPLPSNLPNRVLTKILERVQEYLTQLFQAMSTGGEVLLADVDYFNGGLFDNTPALPLTAEEFQMVHCAAEKDWTEVEAAIFRTLFERSLDPEKRGQLGAHYISQDDIPRIIEPVILEPLRAQWSEFRATAEEFLANPVRDAGHEPVIKPKNQEETPTGGVHRSPLS